MRARAVWQNKSAGGPAGLGKVTWGKGTSSFIWLLNCGENGVQKGFEILLGSLEEVLG